MNRTAPTPPGLGQRLMLTRFYPRVYGWWRPLVARAALARPAQSRADEWAEARRMLRLAPGQRVLDLACGPGNFTGWFASVVGTNGVAIGVDVSPTMLAQARRDHPPEHRNSPVFLRGDAEELPFADGSFDAACCFAALFLMAEPMRALDELTRVLRPGGRLALMTSCGSEYAVARPAQRLVSRVGGVHVFGRDEITGALAERGLVDIDRRVSGLAQFVSAGKAPA